MTTKHAKLIEMYFDAGHIIKIDDSGYVDSEVQGIYENDDGIMVYDSEVFSERPLSEVRLDNVIVANPIRDLKSTLEVHEYTSDDDKYVSFIDGNAI